MANAQAKTGASGWVAAAIVLGLLFAIGMCSSRSTDKTAQSFASPTLTNQIETMPVPAPAPIAALSLASVRKGRQHLTMVLGAEGLSGAMIYSQNCYDALSRNFSWVRLDLCGGFDMLAVAAVDTAATEGLTGEVAYFGSEAAAGRYLALATKAGQEAGEADLRLEALQARARAVAPKPTPSPSLDLDEELAPEGEPAVDNAVVEDV
ncbi:hypothetical protein RZN05_02485 [Sphingomonas sp. HF-S4]|uniref:Lipoprotein n=1 Tax=Sphingomonas agrestis TaxID=3080540 RepID=A0ABU3Y357_9SPHN|nr:hypothetical protein [Sphingomonas sp. HF-S4]MDV3455837.1 hypothetical protein [Sphingomonas sp. HF-S4]